MGSRCVGQDNTLRDRDCALLSNKDGRFPGRARRLSHPLLCIMQHACAFCPVVAQMVRTMSSLPSESMHELASINAMRMLAFAKALLAESQKVRSGAQLGVA